MTNCKIRSFNIEFFQFHHFGMIFWTKNVVLAAHRYLFHLKWLSVTAEEMTEIDITHFPPSNVFLICSWSFCIFRILLRIKSRLKSGFPHLNLLPRYLQFQFRSFLIQQINLKEEREDSRLFECIHFRLQTTDCTVHMYWFILKDRFFHLLIEMNLLRNEFMSCLLS